MAVIKAINHYPEKKRDKPNHVIVTISCSEESRTYTFKAPSGDVEESLLFTELCALIERYKSKQVPGASVPYGGS